MSDTNTAGATQADASADTSTQAVTNTTSEPQAGEETISLDEARKLRRENQTLRQRQKEIDAKEEAAKLAAMGDLEKAQAKADAAEKQIKQYQEQLVHAEIKLAATSKNIINPDLIADNIFKSLEFEDGKPTNLDKALDELIKANPYLIKQSDTQTPAQTGAQQGAPNVPAMNPGRTNIAQPGTLPQGQTMRLEDIYRQQRQR